eukprot:g3651.t1
MFLSRFTSAVPAALYLVALVNAAASSSREINVNLTVGPLRFHGPVSFWTRAYNGKLAGPTIRVPQGGTLRIRLNNALAGPSTDGPLNWFRLPNTTNLHLHGLHVSPRGAADDVFKHVSPGSTLQYVYDIPVDHSPGTYFYHPHVHGSSSNQQGGGMSGALIVEPLDTSTWPQALTAMDEEVLLLQHLCFENKGKYQSSTPYINHLEVVKWGLDNLHPEPVYQDPDAAKDYYLVNGEYLPNVTMSPGQFKRFRLIGAGTSAFLELQIVGKSLCEMWVLQKDGVWVGSESYLVTRPLMTPGMRLDIAVRCNSSGFYSFESQPNAPYHAKLAKSTAVFAGPIFGIEVVGLPVVMKIPRILPDRPKYLPDLTGPSFSTIVDSTLELNFETEGGPFRYGPPFPAMHINGEAFSDKDHFIHNMTLGKIETWNVGIAGDSDVGAGNHPFHVHVNPFQVVSISGGTLVESLGVRVGEYRDTIPLSQSLGRIMIRFVPDRFVGRALIHCHMVPHVDLGMAAVAKILPSE